VSGESEIADVEGETHAFTSVEGRGGVAVDRSLNTTFNRDGFEDREERWTEPDACRITFRQHRTGGSDVSRVFSGQLRKAAVVPLVIATSQLGRPITIDTTPREGVGSSVMRRRCEGRVASSKPQILAS
jgi:hypothetical protein